MLTEGPIITFVFITEPKAWLPFITGFFIFHSQLKNYHRSSLKTLLEVLAKRSNSQEWSFTKVVEFDLHPKTSLTILGPQ